MEPAEVSVVIPTIGRPRLLEQALASLGQCDPGPADIVVVDQSGAPDTSWVVSQSGLDEARVVQSTGKGIGLAGNAARLVRPITFDSFATRLLATMPVDELTVAGPPTMLMLGLTE